MLKGGEARAIKCGKRHKPFFRIISLLLPSPPSHNASHPVDILPRVDGPSHKSHNLDLRMEIPFEGKKVL